MTIPVQIDDKPDAGDHSSQEGWEQSGGTGPLPVIQGATLLRADQNASIEAGTWSLVSKNLDEVINGHLDVGPLFSLARRVPTASQTSGDYGGRLTWLGSNTDSMVGELKSVYASMHVIVHDYSATDGDSELQIGTVRGNTGQGFATETVPRLHIRRGVWIQGATDNGEGTFSTPRLFVDATGKTGNIAELKQSANGAARLKLENGNAGAAATAELRMATDAGAMDVFATSQAAGAFAFHRWNGTGGFYFNHNNASGVMGFQISGQERLRIDQNATNPVLLFTNGSLKRVEVGAIDSGGPGYRALRVTN